jgi:FkbM family methyltransferase
MPETGNVRAFVLVACEDGPMIVNRLDYEEVHGGSGSVGVGTWLLNSGYHEMHEVDALINLMRARMSHRGGPISAIDCGANVGPHTVPFAHALFGWGEVIAIEAQERLFYALAGNIALNNFFNARAIWAAVSDHCGGMFAPVFDYQKPKHFSGQSMKQDGGLKQMIPTLTIDSLGLERCDLIKIDIEGMEPFALRGAAKTIERFRPIISAEHTTCGKELITSNLPAYYRCEDFGMNLLCMEVADVLWHMVTVKDAAE